MWSEAFDLLGHLQADDSFRMRFYPLGDLRVENWGKSVCIWSILKSDQLVYIYILLQVSRVSFLKKFELKKRAVYSGKLAHCHKRGKGLTRPASLCVTVHETPWVSIMRHHESPEETGRACIGGAQQSEPLTIYGQRLGPANCQPYGFCHTVG